MDCGKGGTRTGRLYVTWQRCMCDGRDHAVTDEEFAGGALRHDGRYESVCGHVVTLGSAMLPRGPVCSHCHAFLVARASSRSAEERMGPVRHRKPGWLHRLFHHSETPVVSLPRPPQDAASPERDGRTTIPVGASDARIALASTGSNAKDDGE